VGEVHSLKKIIHNHKATRRNQQNTFAACLDSVSKHLAATKGSKPIHQGNQVICSFCSYSVTSVVTSGNIIASFAQVLHTANNGRFPWQFNF